MWPFSKKREGTVELFCRTFYEKVILNCVIDGVNVNAKLFEVLKNDLAASDSTFANIDSQTFNNEIVALQFELFALAWLHHFGDKLAVNQSVFTKDYLNKNSHNDIWEAMELYNQAIARSTTIGKTPNKAPDRAYITNVNLTRVNLFEQYHKEGHDIKCVARVLNRLFSDKVWKKGTTAGLLLFAFCDRLNFGKDYEPNKETHRRWFLNINDFYEKDLESLSKVKFN